MSVLCLGEHGRCRPEAVTPLSFPQWARPVLSVSARGVFSSGAGRAGLFRGQAVRNSSSRRTNFLSSVAFVAVVFLTH